MRIIGLTGGIASGKSTISQLFRQKGAVIIDADEIAHNLLSPTTKTWYQIVKCFGEDILKDDKSIDRKKLGKMVFADKRLLKILNDITHPKIVEKIRDQIEYHRKSGTGKVLVIDAALLLEVGLGPLVDEIWLVTIERQTQLERLMKRDGALSWDEAMDRIEAQPSQEERAKFAHTIIDNSGSLEETQDKFEALWKDFNSS